MHKQYFAHAVHSMQSGSIRKTPKIHLHYIITIVHNQMMGARMSSHVENSLVDLSVALPDDTVTAATAAVGGRRHWEYVVQNAEPPTSSSAPAAATAGSSAIGAATTARIVATSRQVTTARPPRQW